MHTFNVRISPKTLAAYYFMATQYLLVGKMSLIKISGITPSCWGGRTRFDWTKVSHDWCARIFMERERNRLGEEVPLFSSPKLEMNSDWPNPTLRYDLVFYRVVYVHIRFLFGLVSCFPSRISEISWQFCNACCAWWRRSSPVDTMGVYSCRGKSACFLQSQYRSATWAWRRKRTGGN